jgi:hypothetical protein
MSLEMLTSFLGWVTIINMAILATSAITITALKQPIRKLHAKITLVSEDKLDEFYLSFLGNYKLAILMLNFAPYCALKLMS